MLLESDRLILRALEKKDAATLMIWENNPKFWRVSDTEIPLSIHEIHHFIENQEHFRVSGQLRLMLEDKETKASIGCVDLFDGNSKFRRAAVGILIGEEAFLAQGYAKEGLQIMINYAETILDLHQIYAHIGSLNQNSIHLFEGLGFKKTGELIDWRRWNKQWENVVVYQKILSE